MRKALICAMLLVAACKKAEPHEAREEAMVAEGAGPDVGATLIPGIAMIYRYGFRLPVERIVSVQEEHAAQCEAMTPVKCRVVGMAYEVGRSRTITASLQLKLAPELARRFGKQGIDVVTKRGGMLAYAQIDSEEAGAAVAAADRDNADTAAERARIEQQLKAPGLGSAERTQLQARLAQLADARRLSASGRDEALLKLASTPMRFDYESGDVDPGLMDGPLLGAVKDGWSNVVSGFAIILTLLISLAPWALVAGLLIWAWRRFAGRIGLSRSED